MALRAPLNDPAAVIDCIKRDGGVILTEFSSATNVQKVNEDAAPYIDALVEEVHHNAPSPKSVKPDWRLAGLSFPSPRNYSMHTFIWAE